MWAYEKQTQAERDLVEWIEARSPITEAERAELRTLLDAFQDACEEFADAVAR